ncbi:dolichyl-diphosphooligosaccharide--protein glycosyltransferase subunit Wbp1p [[Candida] jaroonii]|uniref:Dolichyl-diphosphooligosaccharide--protein glycosyltransferase subunit Wbp1p n=1 Tax=[Candida] jaroonii TaxID=467808 RepID=A0ACA9Y9S4_9ASCO|nr:dolichyl-diphosphooligosaccharide--protein glycosyltransferase subunit Wbp1p [[Candida] jaroonii]
MIFQRLILLLSLVWAVIGGTSLIIYDSESIDLDHPTPELLKIVRYSESKFNQTVVRGYTDDDLKIFIGEESIVDKIFILPTTSKKILNKKELNKVNLVKLLEKNVDIVVVGDHEKNYPEDIKDFLNEVGIYPSPKGYKLVDHFNSDDKVKLTKQNIGCSRILSSIDKVYDGQSAIIDNNENLIPIVKASSTSFSTNDNVNSIDNDNTWGIGEQSFVVVGLQSLSGSRLTWFGSYDLIDEEILSWSLGFRNILKLQFVQHHKESEPSKLDGTLYRVSDQVIYTIGVSELADNEWKPYEVEEGDALQLSFKMLDPYQRLNLQPLGKVSSTEDGPLDTFAYFVNFTIPDQHGMFTFELDHKRSGLSYLSDKKVVAVRHLANDEFKRSWEITNAWYYIASAMFVVVGWLIFVVNFIYVSRDDSQRKNI